MGIAIAIGNRIGKSSGQSWSTTQIPTDLNLTIKSDTEIWVDWSFVNIDAEGINIYISTDNVNFTLKGTVAATALTFLADNLAIGTGGTTYYFYVVAYKGSQLNTPSSTISILLEHWYLAGGINNSDVLCAFDFVNAASEAASLVNLANPGTNDLTKVSTPIWTAGLGWNGLELTKSEGKFFKNYCKIFSIKPEIKV